MAPFFLSVYLIRIVSNKMGMAKNFFFVNLLGTGIGKSDNYKKKKDIIYINKHFKRVFSLVYLYSTYSCFLVSIRSSLYLQ